MFNHNSGLVKVWVSLIFTGAYILEQVPQLSNLKDVVSEIIKEYKCELII